MFLQCTVVLFTVVSCLKLQFSSFIYLTPGVGMHGYEYTYSWRFSWITQRYKRLELLYKQSSVNVLAGLQSSFKIVCGLFDKISGVREKAFVQWCSTTWSRSVFVFLITGYVHRWARHFLSPIVELLRLEEWQGHDVCPLSHSLR